MDFPPRNLSAKAWFLGIFLFVFSFSCQKEDEVMPVVQGTEKARLETQEIRFNGEYLEFDLPYSFDNTLEYINSLSIPNFLIWESQFRGFTSLRTLEIQAKQHTRRYLDSIQSLLITNKLDKKELKVYLADVPFVRKNQNSFLKIIFLVST